MFIVIRFNINTQGQESHSQQKYDDQVSAMKRFYSILATDIDNENFMYELVNVIDESGIVIASQVFDNREPEVQHEAS